MSSSLVKVMFIIVLFKVCRICSVLSFLTMAKMSSTHLFLSLMSVLLVTDCDSSCCIIISAVKVDSGDTICVPEICLWYEFCKENSVKRQRLSKSKMSFLSSCVVACQDLSFVNSSFLILWLCLLVWM